MRHRILALLPLLFGFQAVGAEPGREGQSAGIGEADQHSLQIVFDEAGEGRFTADERTLIENIVRQSGQEVRQLLPSLPDDIEVRMVVVDRDVDIVGGVTGQASAPGKVQIELSSVYPGGISAAARIALASTIFHEFHHLYRGWTIQENRYSPGIAIAAVNEGLADVFTETYTGVYFEEASGYPDNVDEWLAEIMLLPTDADYGVWMFEHPDGRNSIGYRVGRFIVHQAMHNGGMDVLALGELSPDEILRLAQASADRAEATSNRRDQLQDRIAAFARQQSAGGSARLSGMMAKR